MKEILQPNTIGLSENDNYSSLAPGFEHSNVTLVFDPNYHYGYRHHGSYLSSIFKETDKILEIGCGAGNLQYFVKSHHPNITYATVDINNDTKSSPYIDVDSHFTAYSNRPFQIVDNDDNNVKFDYILSFEHFEHIEENTLDVLLQNIKNHCHLNTKVIATASKQILPPHVSVFSKEKWVEIIERNGFEMLDETYLNEQNCPPNFPLNSTIELIFKIR